MTLLWTRLVIKYIFSISVTLAFNKTRFEFKANVTLISGLNSLQKCYEKTLKALNFSLQLSVFS